MKTNIKAKILVLYKELSQYFVDCLAEFVQTSKCSAVIVAYQPNKEAPFDLLVHSSIQVKLRSDLNDYELQQLAHELCPELIFVGGWSDQGYINLVKSYPKKTVKLIGFDNPWSFSVRKVLGAVYARIFITPYFNYCFVPGNQQKHFARNMGFRNTQIIEGAYSANTDQYNEYYRNLNDVKVEHHPKRFLYLGRYVKHKGIFELWSAFKRFKAHHPDWELWCVGTGDQFENRIEADGIRHFGFVQPNEMLPILKETGVYVLPSHFEPWGVSVHEMAVAGFPLLLSDAVGARESFLVEGENGHVFKSNNVDSLFDAMLKMASNTPHDLNVMGEKSHELGMRITPELWAKKLLKLLT